MVKSSGLTVRQHERAGIEVPMEFIVDPEHTSQVRFAPSSASTGDHCVPGKAVDISPGGMGLLCRLMLPRMCEGTVRVFDPASVKAGRAAAPAVLFEHRVKVRRVQMASREPTYAIGVAFMNPSRDIAVKTAALLERLGLGAAGARGGKAGPAAHA